MRKWTTTEDRLLKALWEDKTTPPEIAKIMNRTLCSVTCRMEYVRNKKKSYEIKKLRQRWVAQEVELLNEFMDNKVKLPIVAMALNRSYESVRQYVSKMKRRLKDYA